jgi:hypothetical protein
MAISQKYLAAKNVVYDVVAHQPTKSSIRSAEGPQPFATGIKRSRLGRKSDKESQSARASLITLELEGPGGALLLPRPLLQPELVIKMGVSRPSFRHQGPSIATPRPLFNG